MACLDDDNAVGMNGLKVGQTSLTVSASHRIAEYGRTFVDPQYRGQGYGKEIDFFVLYLAFEWLQLGYIWGDVYADNTTTLMMHTSTGWRTVGVDLPGHTDPRGKVTHIEYDRATWFVKRDDFLASFPVELPRWTM